MDTESNMPQIQLPISTKIISTFTADSYVQCSVLLPKQKLELLPQEFANFLKQLRQTFGGYTVRGELYGAWKDPLTGAEYFDSHLEIVIGMQNAQLRLEELKGLVAIGAKGLDELSIFLSFAGGPTFFIWSVLHHETDPEAALLEAPFAGVIQ